jgi:hypothetical protein
MRAPSSAWRWNVVKQRRPTHERARCRLHHNLFGVLPDVFVATPAFLRKIDGGFKLGQEHGQSAGVVQPLQAQPGVGCQNHLL